MDCTNNSIQKRQGLNFPQRYGKNAPHQKLFDMLAPLRRLIHHQNSHRCRHRVDDSDDRFLRDRGSMGSTYSEQETSTQGERQGIPVGGRALDRVPGQ